MTENDTIAAIATPPGRGGIGVIRISGPQAVAVVTPMLRLRHPLTAARVRRAQVLDPETGAVLDEAIATYFASPHSYTAEDVVELSCHGAPVLLAEVLAACLAGGARLAEPGEFTQRAYLAGQLDLTEAEAVHDLVAATTMAQVRTAAAQLGGAVSRAVRPAREGLLALIAELEAGIDFAEDDLHQLSGAELLSRIGTLETSLRALAETYRFGRVLHQGFALAIAGRPNAGKSSLFNCMLRHQRAIVTDQPGTTRDPIAEQLELDGIPVRLIDTAGLRVVPAGDAGEPERQGIARSQEIVAEADVVLLLEEAGKPLAPDRDGVVDANQPAAQEADGLLRELAEQASHPGGRPVLRVFTKADRLTPDQVSTVPAGTLLTSAVTGEGVDALRRAIVLCITGSGMAGAESAVVVNLRQHTALQGCLAALRSVQTAIKTDLPHELFLLDLYQALESLDQLTGATERDEVLNRIFSTFCIGK